MNNKNNGANFSSEKYPIYCKITCSEWETGFLMLTFLKFKIFQENTFFRYMYIYSRTFIILERFQYLSFEKQDVIT